MSEIHRVFNFGAGPAVLPEAVLAQVQRDLLALPGVGMSVLEISHRSPTFTEIIETTRTNIRELAGLPDDYHVLFTTGGATQQFAMVPMNLLAPGRTADYIVTGSWAKKAAQEAKRFGSVHIAANTETEEFTCVPERSELTLSTDSAYVHLTSNNTIFGTQWRQIPKLRDRVLIVDASSDIFSRPLDFGEDGIDLIYAGAQKNLGPAGVTLVIVRDELLQQADEVDRILPTMLQYATYAKSASLHNTPPVFAIYVLGLVTQWILENGGLELLGQQNERKAQKVYEAIDCSDFYQGTAQPKSRSWMNVTIRLPSEDLEIRFISEAATAGLVGLKGHRSVGGIRASIYNAFPESGVDALVEFMREFERVNG
jgi:phosphoserine aminotransferase